MNSHKLRPQPAGITLRRCGCPYRDCWVLIDTPSGLCPTCERVCAEAYRIDHGISQDTTGPRRR